MPITTSSLNLFRADFEDTSAIAAKDVPKPAWNHLVAVDGSQRDVYIKHTTGFRYATEVNEGDPNPTDVQLALPQLTLSQKRYGIKYMHTIEAEKFDPNGMVAVRAKEIGKAVEAAKEKHAVNLLLNNAFDSSYPISTGDPLFSDSHTLGDLTAFDNLATAASLSWSTLETMLTALGSQVDPRNRKMPYRGKMYLLVPPALEFTAAALAESALRPSTADNDKNVIKDRFMPIVLDEATSSTAFALVPANKEDHGGRKAVRIESEAGFDTDEDGFAKFTRYTLFDTGFAHPFNVYGNAGA